jgi:hypothetical protein
MKLGFVIPFVGPAVSSAAGLSAFCRGLEDLGYDTLWVGDRLVTPVDVRSRCGRGGEAPVAGRVWLSRLGESRQSSVPATFAVEVRSTWPLARSYS